MSPSILHPTPSRRQPTSGHFTIYLGLFTEFYSFLRDCSKAYENPVKLL